MWFYKLIYNTQTDRVLVGIILANTFVMFLVSLNRDTRGLLSTCLLLCARGHTFGIGRKFMCKETLLTSDKRTSASIGEEARLPLRPAV